MIDFNWLPIRKSPVWFLACSFALIDVGQASAQVGPSPFPATPAIPSGTVVQHQETPDDAAVPANFPDKFVWKLFLEVNQKAAHQGPINGQAGGPISNDAVWETWASDQDTFPAHPDPANKPVWPATGQETKKGKLLNRTQLHRMKLLRAQGAQAQPVDVNKLPEGGFKVPDQKGIGEEIHRNKVTFDYIVDNGLWYQEGIAEFFAKAASAVQDDVEFTAKGVNFPRKSIEVKANWIVITEADKPRFHWNYNASGQLLGLVAMHISSKDLPNWVWSTFEHIDNPGRGDFIGIHDSFGADPHHIPSNTDAAGKTYPPEKMTPELLKLFDEYHYTGDWAAQFKHYRLKGAQIDFTDSTGRPLLLGNSVTEAGFVPTASCITCHSRAAVQSDGTNSFPGFPGKNQIPGFGQQMTLPLLNGDPLQPFITYNGLPDPNWFYTEKTSGASLNNLQVDFVWAIPFNAQSSKKPK